MSAAAAVAAAAGGLGSPPALLLSQQEASPGFSGEGLGLKGLLGSAVAAALFDRTPEASPASSPEGKVAVRGVSGAPPAASPLRAASGVAADVSPQLGEATEAAGDAVSMRVAEGVPQSQPDSVSWGKVEKVEGICEEAEDPLAARSAGA
jgi:hypothetical protein